MENSNVLITYCLQFKASDLIIYRHGSLTLALFCKSSKGRSLQQVIYFYLQFCQQILKVSNDGRKERRGYGAEKY